MMVIDFHKYTQKRVAQSQSGFVSKADMFLAISIRRTSLSIAFKRPSGANADACEVDPLLFLTQS